MRNLVKIDRRATLSDRSYQTLSVRPYQTLPDRPMRFGSHGKPLVQKYCSLAALIQLDHISLTNSSGDRRKQYDVMDEDEDVLCCDAGRGDDRLTSSLVTQL